ncbi:alpha-1,3-arabinosyltransferase XAT3-like [Zingiber officinale]|uniref:alpha-1,3-arabinosyltransferase XAT3-like n=1 Tax=Zingiber officinale TaxID=94328 RepID=UPI001C4BC9B2|nr:alpha-1,3-arabinosyltransferase XAT3-like [Zingiber officinale]
MKSTRAFSRAEPRRAGNAFIISSMLLSLCVLSLIRARYCSSAYAKRQTSPELEATMDSVKMVTARSRKLALKGQGDGALGKRAEEISAAADKLPKRICVETSRRSDVCEAEGDVRVQGSSQTVFLPASLTSRESKVKPYARKHDQFALSNVKEWTLKPFPYHERPAVCTENHTVPVVVFSTAGFTGNLFHDFTDVLVPLFITTAHFNGEVQFMVADAKAWWLSKFGAILDQLSKYEVIDADIDGTVRCFPRVIAGLSFHKDLGVDPSKTPAGARSMADFKAMLRRAYGLERERAETSGNDTWDVRRKPRLLIISRRGSRVLLNERGMADMAMSLGFDVRVAEPEIATDLGKFARLVNSADVMVGVHGAGLANLVFLPKGAVFVQVVPMGDLTWLARDTFGTPAPEMDLHYLEYLIQADESTLSDQYPKDHPVFKDPQSIHRKGWNELSRVYLENQNVKPHLGRLRLTLLEALKLLPHNHKHNKMAH